MTTPKLKPCPFCGFTPEGILLDDRPTIIREPTTKFRLICAACVAKGPLADTQLEAIAAWNRRAEKAEDELEEMKLTIRFNGVTMRAIQEDLREAEAELERARPLLDEAMRTEHGTNSDGFRWVSNSYALGTAAIAYREGKGKEEKK